MRERRAEGRARLAFEPAPGLSKRRVLNNILLTTACATDAARTKCIFCSHEAENVELVEDFKALPEFCPNAKFFSGCAAAYMFTQTSE